MKYVVLLLFSLPALGAEPLSLVRYMDQVTKNHELYKAAEESFKAGQLMANEADLAIATTLFGNVSKSDDAKPNLLFNYDKFVDTNYKFGFKKQTSIGLSGKLYYNYDDLTYQGIAFNGPPSNITGTQGSPTLELTLPLWRNFWGGETDSQMDQQRYKTSAQKNSASFNMKSILAGAESAYWELALARESVKVSKDAVTRATELYKWNSYRANSGLTDKADFLQSDAALQTRKLELKSAQDAETIAARNFNSNRGLDASEVSDQLVSLTASGLDQLKIPKRAEMRDDTKAALDQAHAEQASDEQARQIEKPTLELYGTAALNNNNPVTDKSNAINNSFSGSRPTQIVGVRFETPLDIGLVRDARKGHAAAIQSAQLTYHRKLFEQESGWHDLTEKFQQAKDRLAIYDNLEKVQKAKSDYERMRRQKGRTTTFQVIQFETEYEQTQLARIKTMSEVLQLLAQMKTY